MKHLKKMPLSIATVFLHRWPGGTGTFPLPRASLVFCQSACEWGASSTVSTVTVKPDGNLHCASWETNKTLHIRQHSVRGIYSCRTPDMSARCAEGKVEAQGWGKADHVFSSYLGWACGVQAVWWRTHTGRLQLFSLSFLGGSVDRWWIRSVGSPEEVNEITQEECGQRLGRWTETPVWAPWEQGLAWLWAASATLRLRPNPGGLGKYLTMNERTGHKILPDPTLRTEIRRGTWGVIRQSRDMVSWMPGKECFEWWEKTTLC